MHSPWPSIMQDTFAGLVNTMYTETLVCNLKAQENTNKHSGMK